jgi:hypothetical protein
METACASGWIDVTSAVTAVALVILAFVAWRTSKSIDFFTGAISSINQAMLRVQVEQGRKDTNIGLKWWDKNIADVPVTWRHDNRMIYAMIPHGRRRPRNSFVRAWQELTGRGVAG